MSYSGHSASCETGRREEFITVLSIEDRVTIGTTRLGLWHNRFQAGAKDSEYKHALMPKRKEGRSKSQGSFLHLVQRQQIVPFLNYLWCYLGSIYRLWSGSLLEVHSPNCINLVALSVSHMSFLLSQPEMHYIPLCWLCDLSALLLNCWS